MFFCYFLTIAYCLFTGVSQAQEILSPAYQKEIRVEVFKETAAAPYTEQMFQISKEVYREYPYLYLCSEGDGYEDYFKSLVEIDDSMVCLAFDGENVVGVATGVPSRKDSHLIREAFSGQEHLLDELYYLGVLVLLPEYRKQGIGPRLYSCFEAAVREMGSYSHIGLCQIEDTRYASLKPPGYIPNDGFWQKLGFAHYPQFGFTAPWVNVGGIEELPHWLVFWIKPI